MDTKNLEAIHEGIIRDVWSMLTDGTISPEEMFMNIISRRNFKNIARATSSLILTFPVITDTTVPLKTARLITKAVEVRATAMLQMLFAALSVQANRDAFDFVSKVHTNISTDDIEMVLKSMNSMEDFSESYRMTEDEKFAMREVLQAMAEENAIIDDFTLSVNDDFTSLNEEYLIEAVKGGKGSYNASSYNSSNGGGNKGGSVSITSTNGNGKFKVTSSGKACKNGNGGGGYRGGGRGGCRDDDIEVPEVLNAEIKKENELQPTLMEIQFRGPDDNTGKAIIGVKAKLHYIDRDDIIDRINSKNKDRNGLFNFLRATTREISFFKDFLFAADKAKLDAVKVSKDASPIWKLLERRAVKSRINSIFSYTNDAAAITTILISKDTADILKSDYELDVLRPTEVLEIMDAYNIMAFVITDDVNERAWILFDDGSKEYETFSYMSLEKQSNDKDLKKLIQVMASGR